MFGSNQIQAEGTGRSEAKKNGWRRVKNRIKKTGNSGEEKAKGEERSSDEGGSANARDEVRS